MTVAQYKRLSGSDEITRMVKTFNELVKNDTLYPTCMRQQAARELDKVHKAWIQLSTNKEVI